MPLYVAAGVYIEEFDAQATAIDGVSSSAGCACDTPLVRPRYFPGQLLDAETLACEQRYQRDLVRRHHREIDGFGVVHGLGVNIDASAGVAGVRVDPGAAIDAQGNLIVLCRAVAIALPANAEAALVTLRAWDRPCDPVAAVDGEESSRIEDACIVALSSHPVPAAVPLARLLHQSARWRADGDFAVPRARCSPAGAR